MIPDRGHPAGGAGWGCGDGSHPSNRFLWAVPARTPAPSACPSPSDARRSVGGSRPGGSLKSPWSPGFRFWFWSRMPGFALRMLQERSDGRRGGSGRPRLPRTLTGPCGGQGDGSGGSGRLRRRRRVLARCRRSGRLGGRHLAGFWSLRVLDLAGQDLGRLRRGGVGRRWRCVRCRGHWQARRGQVAALALGGAFARSAGAWQGFASQDAFSVEEGA